MLKKCLYAFSLLPILLIALPAQGQAKRMDKITIKNADKIEDVEGQIVKDDETGVSYHPASALTKTEDKSLADVISIRFYDTPQGLQDAENERGSGNYEQALTLFEVVITEIKGSKTKYRPFLLQYALYGKAATNVALESYSEAIASYRQLLSEVPATRFKKDAYLGWLDCGREMKDIQVLQDLLTETEKDTSNIAKNSSFNVRLSMADLELSNGDPQAALKTYKQLSSSRDKDVANKSWLGQIACLEQLKDKASIDSLINTISVSGETSPFLLVVVYTSQGDTQFKVASEKKDVSKYHDALILYLKAISLGFPTKEVDAYYQRALYNAAVCYQTLAGLLNKPGLTDKYKKQAKALFDLLILEHKDSELAKKAREMMESPSYGK
ncbi:MAG: hypothetical protein AAB019_00760 [Planctomycetota bacterium]